MSGTIDPTVLEVLDGISKSGATRLKNLLSKGMAVGSAVRGEPVPDRDPLYSRAEQHLLREHRQEVAYLLYKACQRAMTEMAPSESMVHRCDDGNSTLEIPDDAWFSRERQGLTTVRGGPDVEDARSLLTGSETGAGHAAALAKASLLICPRDETRLWLGLSLSAQGLEGEGRRVALDVLAHHPTQSNASYARQLLGWSYLVEGEPHRAVEEYLAAYRCDESRSSSLAAAVHAAVLANDLRLLMCASGLLAEHRDGFKDVVVEEHVSFWVERRRRGSFNPSPPIRDLAIAVAGDLPLPARRVIGAFY